MQTTQELIDSASNNVAKILSENYSGYLNFGSGSFAVNSGSSQIIVVVRPYGNNDAAVECMANVATNGNITPELMKYLLRKNAELHFGAFGLLFDGTVIFAHTIAGANLDENELITSLNSVAAIADHYDEEIAAMSGGKRDIEASDIE